METVLIIFLLSIWVPGYKAIFIAEWSSLKAVPLLMKVSYIEKNRLIWGDYFKPVKDGLSATHEESTVYFLNYCPEAKAMWQWLLARYHLPPREVIIYNLSETNRNSILTGDYVIACICREMSDASAELLAFLEQPPFDKISTKAYQYGHYSIYRVGNMMEGTR